MVQKNVQQSCWRKTLITFVALALRAKKVASSRQGASHRKPQKLPVQRVAELASVDRRSPSWELPKSASKYIDSAKKLKIRRVTNREITRLLRPLWRKARSDKSPAKQNAGANTHKTKTPRS